MKILFLTGVYPPHKLDELNKFSNGLLQNSGNVFQWALIDGLVCNNADFHVLSLPFLPVYPLRATKMITPKGDVMFNNRKIGDMLSYCALVGYKNISIRKKVKKYVERWLKENVADKNERVVILTFTILPMFSSLPLKLTSLFSSL